MAGNVNCLLKGIPANIGARCAGQPDPHYEFFGPGGCAKYKMRERSISKSFISWQTSINPYFKLSPSTSQ